jgi:cytochrome c oxidase subunit II
MWSELREARHFRRFLVIWLGLSVIATPLIAILFTPDLPPGLDADDAQGQQVDNEVLTAVATPVVLLVLVFLVYVLVVFRETGPLPADGPVEGPRTFGNPGVQTVWIVASTVIVIALFVFGTWRLLQAGAAGGGQGPTPLSPLHAADGTSVLPVQVIGQQWQFTYRYPTYGGLETPHLVLPLGRPVELHVTSLDVIHSFWAYQLGVKADANPGVDNVAYVIPRRLGTFDVRCAELCGIWHGYMFDTGRVVGEQEFAAWVSEQRSFFEPVQRYLPRYGDTYLPAPQGRAG